MKFQIPSFKLFFERTDERTHTHTHTHTHTQTSRKQYAPHFSKVGGIKNIIMSSFKSSRDIQKKEGGSESYFR